MNSSLVPFHARVCRGFSLWTSWIGVAVGAVVLVGWWAGIRVFTNIGPGLATMKPETATAFVLSGAALRLLLFGPGTSRAQIITGRTVALLVFLLGFGTLIEYWLKLDVGIDNLFFSRMLASTGIEHPGRMAPSTALAFVLLGTSLTTLDFRIHHKYRPSELLALGVTLVGFIALLGYLYDVKGLYGVSAYASMALHTAALFCLLGLGTFVARPNDGVVEAMVSDRLGGIMARRFLPFAVIAPVILGWLRLRAQHAGWFGTEFGAATLVAGCVIIFTIVVWVNAGWLNHSDEARASAEKRDHQLAAIVSSSEDAIVAKTLSGIITDWNHGAELLYGYTATEVVGKPISILQAPDRLQEQDEILSRIRRGEHVEHRETKRRKKDGTLVDISLSVSPIRNAEGATVGASAIARDITRRKEEEQKFLQSEERFAKAFSSSPISITISTEAEGRYVDVNEAFLRMLGYERGEVVGHTVEELDVWSSYEDRRAMIEQLGHAGRVTALETEFNTKAGEKRVTQISAELISLNNIRCVLAITRDITETKRLEEQFRQAQKMEAVGRLAGGIAHDFNNLLGVIIGYSDLASESLEAGTRVHRHLEQIRTAGHRAVGLTRQLLAFSRQQVLQPVLLNLNAVVNNLSSMLLRMIGEDIRLSLIPGAPLGSVQADPGQMEQVLMNLVVNARDAMPKGGRILIETANAELDDAYVQLHPPPVQPGPYVMLSVSDTGCGMDATTMSRIFEPFFTTKPLGKGTGLGLSMVYGVVRQSSGSVCVYSEPGKGTTFKLYFPRVDEEAGPLVRSEAAALIPEGTETILLVEDDNSLSELTANLLKSGGYTVLQADGGPAAIAISNQYQGVIHLVLTDVIMPDMSGVELSAKLIESHSQLRIVYMSGYTGDLIANHGVLSPDFPLIQKPFTKRALLIAVRAALDNHLGPLNP